MGKRFSDAEILSEINRVAEIVGESPSVNEFNAHAEMTHGVAANRFGSWNEAKAEAGFDTNDVRRGSESKMVWYRQQKRSGVCGRCDEDFGPALTYHHVDPDAKTAGVREIASASYAEYDLDDLKDEVEKCVLLCQNCHRKVHHDDHSASI